MSLTTYVVLACSIAVAGTVGYFKWQNGRLTTQLEAATLTIGVQQNQVEQAKAVADENIAAVERIRADLKRQEEVAAKAQAAERKRTAALSKLQKEIANAPSRDAPVPDVIEHVLDSLRSNGDGAPATNGPDEDPSGAATGDGGEPKVSPEAGPTS